MKLLLVAALIGFTFANAQVLKVDTAKSTVGWYGSKPIGKSHNGNIALKEGSIELKDGKIVAGLFVADMKTITNVDLKDSPEFQNKLVSHLKSSDFFDVEKYPTATFKVKSATKKSDTEYTFKGDLTFLDKTNEIEFPAKVKIDKDSATGEAKIKVNRTKWGLKYNSGSFFKDLGDKLISDEFEITLNISAKK